MSDELLALVTQINAKVDSVADILDEHVKDEMDDISRHVAKILSEAFPEGDLKMHYSYHQLAINKARAQTAFWEDLAKSVAHWGLIGFLSWMLYIVWKALLAGPNA